MCLHVDRRPMSGWVCYPAKLATFVEDIHNLELRPDDVWVCTYPKSGTTWTQEMIWQIKHDFDPEGGKADLDSRFPMIEVPMFVRDGAEVPPQMEAAMREADNALESLKRAPSPRFIKTHLPPNLLPPALLDTCKVVFVARNPKDCCASYYNHESVLLSHGLKKDVVDFPTYAKFFLEGKVVYGDYWYHLEQCWKFRNHPNALFLWFEDMKQDLITAIRKTAKHLGVHLADDKVLQISDHLCFDNFKKNPAVNKEKLSAPGCGSAFVNRGVVGNFSRHFTAETEAEWDDWIAENAERRGIGIAGEEGRLKGNIDAG